jgi:hypothetical protein
MRGKIRVLSVSIMLFVVAVLTIHAGGPPIVTIEKLPEYFVVGQPFALKFAVRSYCCNHLPLENLYTVRAIAAGPPVINASAMPTKIPGEYTATLTLPRAGKWTITVETGNHVFTALLPIDAIPAGARMPKPLSQGMHVVSRQSRCRNAGGPGRLAGLVQRRSTRLDGEKFPGRVPS